MSENDFANGVYRKGILEMLRVHNFSTTRESCVNVLVDVLRSFVFNVGYASVSFSSISGRSDQNTLDVKQSLNVNSISLHELRSYLRLMQQKDSKKQKKKSGQVNKPQFLLSVPHFPVNVKSDFLTNPPMHPLPRPKKSGVVPPPPPTSASTVTSSASSVRSKLLGPDPNLKKDGSDENKEDKEFPDSSQPVEDENDEDGMEELPFLPPFPPEYTYKFTNRDFLKQRKDKEWNQILAGERKEVEKSLTRIHRSELERYSRNVQYFGKDDWIGGTGPGGPDKATLGKDQREGENREGKTPGGPDDEEEAEGVGGQDEVLVNPYIIISSRKQGLFRDTLVDKLDGNSNNRIARGEKRTIPDNVTVRGDSRSKKRKRPVITDDGERQRTKRFRIDKDSHFSQTAHDLLTRTQTYVEKGKKK